MASHHYNISSTGAVFSGPTDPQIGQQTRYTLRRTCNTASIMKDLIYSFILKFFACKKSVAET